MFSENLDREKVGCDFDAKIVAIKEIWLPGRSAMKKEIIKGDVSGEVLNYGDLSDVSLSSNSKHRRGKIVITEKDEVSKWKLKERVDVEISKQKPV